MESGVRPVSQPSVGELVSGILKDAKQLVVEGAELAKLEVKDELRKAKTAAVAVGVGIGVAAVGGVLLILMLVHLLDAYTTIPLWGCYGIVGGALVLIGGVLLVTAKHTD
jgi:Putative Actinobacterial Holin-X, holin superfamily III